MTVKTKKSPQKTKIKIGGKSIDIAALVAQNDPAPEPTLSQHLANRMQFGPSWGDYQRIEAMGAHAFIEEQLNPDSIDDSYAENWLASLPNETQAENRQQLYDRRNATYSQSVKPVTESRYATWVRILYSKKQLQERMVEFWHNHFNIYGWNYTMRSFWPDWDRLIRQHSFGNFRLFLELTSQHPCMLYYLDNYISTDAGPNENYAREVFELHTFGKINYNVDGGFIDQDVYESSRCFTGWTFNRDSDDPGRGNFMYEHDDHDRFIKLILGNIFPGDQAPLKDGRDVLDLIAYHPGTAYYICEKLCRRFIGDEPSYALVQSAADVWIAHHSSPDQIRQVMRFILNTSEFQNTRSTKFKRPLDWCASTMRATGMPFSTDSRHNYEYDRLGQPMWGWSTPDGPPDRYEDWASSGGLLTRWNWVFKIVSGWYKNDQMEIDTDALLDPSAQSPYQIADYLIERILLRLASDSFRNTLVDFIADGRSYSQPLSESQRSQKARYATALCVMSREFMFR